jgi:phytoene synthase
MDFGAARYARWKDLYRYCWRVASVVGLMVSRTFGRTEPRVFKQVIACGIAMQLTNILRDVGEDLDRGRIYLPREDMERFGVTEAMLLERRATEPVRRLLALEIAGSGLLARGEPVLGSVRGRVRMTAELAVGLYGRILDRIEANDYDVFTRRASVSLPAKLGTVPRVLLTAWLPRGRGEAERARVLRAWPSS